MAGLMNIHFMLVLPIHPFFPFFPSISTAGMRHAYRDAPADMSRGEVEPRRRP